MIKNKTNDKVYIGITRNDIKTRWRHHKAALRHNHHCNAKLQNAFNKYGESAFEFSVLNYFEDINDEELERLEIETISRLDSTNRGYNIQIGGKPMNSVARKHMSDSHKGLKYEGHRKLSDQQALYIMCILDNATNVIRLLSRLHRVTRPVIKGLKNKKWYQDVVFIYEKMNAEQKTVLFCDAVEFYKREFNIDITQEVKMTHEKLTDGEALNIHILYSCGYGSSSQIGRLYNVKKDCILNILRGNTYKTSKEIFKSLSENDIKNIYNTLTSNTTT